MAQNVAKSPAVARATVQVRKVAQRLRATRKQLREARKNLLVVIEQTRQGKGARVIRSATNDRLELIKQKLAAVSPHGLSMIDLYEQCKLKRPTAYQLLRYLVASGVVRSAAKGRNSRWTLMQDEVVVQQPIRKPSPVSTGRKHNDTENHRRIILEVLAKGCADGVRMSDLRSLLPRDCDLAKASQSALSYHLRGLVQDGKIALTGHARGARWRLVGAYTDVATSKSEVCIKDLNQQFLATVPETWCGSKSEKKLRPSSSQHWMSLAELVWDLYPHRVFDEFERLVVVYAPYTRYDVSMLASAFREERLREAYLALQKRFGSRIDATPLPQAVRDRVVGRKLYKRPIDSATITPPPVVALAPTSTADQASDELPEKLRKRSARSPGEPRVKTIRPKFYRGERFCPYIKDNGVRCGTRLRPTNPGPYCSSCQEKVAWDNLGSD